MTLSKEHCVNLLQGEKDIFKQKLSTFEQKWSMDINEIGYRFRSNNFFFEMKKIETRNYEHILAHIGCMAVAPYSKIAILTVSDLSWISETEFFKDKDNYGSETPKNLRFVYSIDRDEKSIKSVKKFMSGVDGDNLHYIDKVSDIIFDNIISATFAEERPNIKIEDVMYKDKHFNVTENGSIMKDEFVNLLLTDQNIEINKVSEHSKIKEKNDFIFTTKEFSIKHGNYNHSLELKVGRSKLNPDEKFAVIIINDFNFQIKLNKNNGELNYRDNSNELMLDCLSPRLKEEISLIEDVVLIEDVSRVTMYALKNTVETGDYDGSSDQHTSIMATSENREDLVKRYNKSVMDKNDSSILIKEGEYNVNYAGNTRGGYSSVRHYVFVEEFRDFDMPELEKY